LQSLPSRKLKIKVGEVVQHEHDGEVVKEEEEPEAWRHHNHTDGRAKPRARVSCGTHIVETAAASHQWESAPESAGDDRNLARMG
jgi:hypothetical protein